MILAACGGSGSEPSSSAFVFQTDEETVPADVPEAMKTCYECHQDIVAQYMEHGMARSIGPVGTPAPGVVINPQSGNRYEIYTDEGEPAATRPITGTSIGVRWSRSFFVTDSERERFGFLSR